MLFEFKIKGTNRYSECMYCGSRSYGKGCLYGPAGTHVHTDDPSRCIYCGSISHGLGCPHNPHAKFHVHGLEYNNMLKETVQKNFMIDLFFKRLFESFENMQAFKLGLIDEQGHLIKKPQTEEEKASITPFDHYIFKLRRLLGEAKLQYLSNDIAIELVTEKKDDFNVEKYEKEVIIKNKFKDLIQDFSRVLSDGLQEGFSKESLELFLLETFLDEECNNN
jgi:hypothetical protein